MNQKNGNHSCWLRCLSFTFIGLIISILFRWNIGIQIIFLLSLILFGFLYPIKSSKKNILSKTLLVSFLGFLPLFFVLTIVFFVFRKFPDGLQKISGFNITIIAVFSFLLNKYLDSIVNFEWETLDNEKSKEVEQKEQEKDKKNEKRETEDTRSFLQQKGFEKIVRMGFFFVLGTAFLVIVIPYNTSHKSDVYYSQSGDIWCPEKCCFPINTNDFVLSGIFSKIDDKKDLEIVNLRTMDKQEDECKSCSKMKININNVFQTKKN